MKTVVPECALVLLCLRVAVLFVLLCLLCCCAFVLPPIALLLSGEVEDIHPTSDSSATGTPGWGNSYRLASIYTLLQNLCPSSTAGEALFYVGQHNADGSSLADSSCPQWLVWTDKVGETIKYKGYEMMKCNR